MTQHAKKQYSIVRIIKNIMKLDIWGLILPPICATLGIGITLSWFIVITSKIILVLMGLSEDQVVRKRRCLEIPDHLLLNNLKEKSHNWEWGTPDYVNVFLSSPTLLYWSRLWRPCPPPNIPGSSTTLWSLGSQTWNGSFWGHPSSSSANTSPCTRQKWLKSHVSTNKSFLHPIFSETSNVPNTLLGLVWNTNIKHDSIWFALGIKYWPHVDIVLNVRRGTEMDKTLPPRNI